MKMMIPIISLLIIPYCYCGPGEKSLLKHLFDQNRPDAHNVKERPVSNHNDSVEISTSFILFQITEVNWYDPHFIWNADDYSGISKLNLPSTAIWKPTLLLYTSANQNFDQKYPCHVIITNQLVEGSKTNIQWMPPGLMYSTCQMNVAWFPFDNQDCTYKFGTWSYNSKEINLKVGCSANETSCKVDLTSYSKHSEWALIDAVFARNEEIDNGQEFSVLEVTLFMQRRALYYLFNLIAPCMVISIMALLVFALPPDANEKISLGVTILLSLTLFLQMVANKLPQTSESIPILSIYFCVTMCISSLSLVCTVVLLNCRYHPSDILSVPWWIDVLVNQYIARALLMPIHKWEHEATHSRVRKSDNKKHESRMNSWKNISNENIEFRPLSIKTPKTIRDYEYDMEVQLNSGKDVDVEPGLGHVKCSMSGGIRDLELILKEVRFITEKLRELNYESDVSACWKYANKVLDRFCLVIFSLFLFGTFIILPIAPKFIESFTVVGHFANETA